MRGVELPREPVFYHDEMNSKKANTVSNINAAEDEDGLKEIMDKFNANNQNFISAEALKIFCRTQDEGVALRALELLRTVAQPF